MANQIFKLVICIGLVLLTRTQTQAQLPFPQELDEAPKQEPSRPVGKSIYISESKQIVFSNSIFKRSKVIRAWVKAIHDRQGRVTEVISYRSDGKTDGKSTYKYDERGNEIERVNYDVNNIITVKVNRKFDQRNRLLEELWFQPSYARIANGNYRKTIVKYDDQKREQETLEYDGKDTLVRRILIKYNPDGTKSEEVCENPECGYAICLIAKRVYQYDSKGNQIEQADYDKSGKYKGGTLRKYNDQSKETEWEIPSIMRVAYTYDSSGTKIESTTFHRDGQITTKERYDSAGRVVILAGRRPDGAIEKDFYEREYDAYGSLVKEVWRRKAVSDPSRLIPPSEWLKDEKDKGEVVQIMEYTTTYYE